MEELLRQIHAASVPIIGICFGHQILAQALGARVEKFEGGWSVGAVDYQLSDGEEATVLAWHSDQVVELPEGAEVIGQSDFCQYAMLRYGDRALTIQPHPEFNPGFVADLLTARTDVVPADIAKQALEGIDKKLSSSLVADQFETFFKMTAPGR